MIQMTYTLVATLEDAKKIARTLVQEKLAACVNILPDVLSVYEWKGRLEEPSEVGLVIKSNLDAKERLLNRLKELHPYELPAISSFEVETTVEYEAWVSIAIKKSSSCEITSIAPGYSRKT